MKKQIFTLMLGAAICTTSSVFAMDYEKRNTTAHAKPTINKAQVHPLNLDQMPRLQDGDMKLLFGVNGVFGNQHLTYVMSNGTMYKMDRPALHKTIAALRTLPCDNTQTRPIDIMSCKKITANDTIVFLFQGGNFEVPVLERDSYTSPLVHGKKTVSIPGQQITFTKVPASYYN